MSESRKSKQVYCVACKRLIRGKPRIMMLQITSSELRFIEKAKRLGFTSSNWAIRRINEGKLSQRLF